MFSHLFSVPSSEFSCSPEAVAALQWLLISGREKHAVLGIVVSPDDTFATISTPVGDYTVSCTSSKKRQESSILAMATVTQSSEGLQCDNTCGVGEYPLSTCGMNNNTVCGGIFLVKFRGV